MKRRGARCFMGHMRAAADVERLRFARGLERTVESEIFNPLENITFLSPRTREARAFTRARPLPLPRSDPSSISKERLYCGGKKPWEIVEGRI